MNFLHDYFEKLMALAFLILLVIFVACLVIIDMRKEKSETYPKVITVKGCDYIQFKPYTGDEIIHSESCPNHKGVE